MRTYFFVRHDAFTVTLTLTLTLTLAAAVYEGPFLVVTRSDKYFTMININGCNDTVSIDRLKPSSILTHLKDDEQPPKRPPPRPTLSP